jgi:hypothetical protein
MQGLRLGSPRTSEVSDGSGGKPPFHPPSLRGQEDCRFQIQTSAFSAALREKAPVPFASPSQPRPPLNQMETTQGTGGV